MAGKRAVRLPLTRVPKASPAALAEMLSVAKEAVGRPLWVDTGAEQLIVPLRSAKDVEGAHPHPDLLASLGYREARGESMAYVWGPDASGGIVARFFFLQEGSLVEDPATGSACANLGGYLVATGHPLPVRWSIEQGVQTGRPSSLTLAVEPDGSIFVSGHVVEIGRGALEL